MGQYTMLIIGALILAGGIFLKDKKVGSITQERVIALGTYAGWVLMCIPVSKLTTPFFANMSGNWPTTGVLVVQVVAFIVGAELFIKKPFDPHAADRYREKPDTGKGNKGKNAKKAKEEAGFEERKPKKAGSFKKLN